MVGKEKNRDDFDDSLSDDNFDSDAEVEVADARSQPDERDASDAAILAEIETLSNKKPSWLNAIILLVVSAVLFAGAGAASWDWKFTLLLLPILFFHELGHYLAMVAFKYRNLRMFFIPFFGAAVTGQHYNVPGWKKAIVSLAGPVPGIALGVVLGIAGIVMKQIGNNEAWSLMLEGAVLMLVLNGLNLLPVLPLDGGWVMHTVLFVRHVVLDVAFRVMAAIALILGGVVSSSKFLVYMGIFLLIGIPAAFRIGRIANKLRSEGLPATSAGGETIPTETALAIIDELRLAHPRGIADKTAAQLTLKVFEQMNSRPPGIFASLLLGGVYGMSLIVALGAGATFIFASRVDLQKLADDAATDPQTSFECSSIRTFAGKEFSGVPAGEENTIIAKFATRKDAEQAFDELSPQFPRKSQAIVFGQTVLLALPAEDEVARESWLARFDQRASSAFVQTRNYRSQLTLVCLAKTEKSAEEIETEIEQYFAVPFGAHLVTPWDPDRSVSKKDEFARKTFAQLSDQREFFAYLREPKYQELGEQIVDASRRGDRKKAEELQKDRTKLIESQKAERIDRIRQKGAAEVDLAVLELYTSQPEMKQGQKFEEFKKLSEDWGRRLGERMGQLPLENGAPTRATHRYSAHSGMASSNSLRLRFDMLDFERPIDGLAAFTNWLCEQGFVQFKYELEGSAGFDDYDE